MLTTFSLPFGFRASANKVMVEPEAINMESSASIIDAAFAAIFCFASKLMSFFALRLMSTICCEGGIALP